MEFIIRDNGIDLLIAYTFIFTDSHLTHIRTNLQGRQKMVFFL